MNWYSADTTDAKFERHFTEFITIQGGERVADLLPKGIDAPLNADYLLWGRTVVAELKCITKDRYHDDALGRKFLRLYSSWVKRGLRPPVRHTAGPQLQRHILGTDGLPESEQRKAASIFNEHLKTRISKASRQIRTTKQFLQLPHAKGLLMLVNLRDASLSPKVAWDAIGYEIGQHRNGTISSVVYMSPVADRRFGRATTPIWLSGPCFGQAGIDAALLHELCVGWDAFVSDGKSRVISVSAAELEGWPEPPESRR